MKKNWRSAADEDEGTIASRWRYDAVARHALQLAQDRRPSQYRAGAQRELAALLPLWLGFLAGTALGAIAYVTFGVSCVLLAIVPVGGLALWYAGFPTREGKLPEGASSGETK
jgi:hypothetical protein